MKANAPQFLAALLLTLPLPLYGQEEQASQTKQEDRFLQLDFVQVGEDNTSLVFERSGRKFVPWGFNYDHDGPGRLIEDYWDDEWPMIIEDFREMKEHGATVVRIHLQVGKFMNAPDKANEHPLQQLARLVVSEKDG
jgi:hypothetical protein